MLLAVFRVYVDWCEVMLAVDAWICCVGLVWVVVAGKQWRDLIISPKRVSLA